LIRVGGFNNERRGVSGKGFLGRFREQLVQRYGEQLVQRDLGKGEQFKD